MSFEHAELRSLLTEDELLAVQWKRDMEAHVELNGYSPTIKNGRIDWIRQKTLVGPVHHDRVHNAVRSVRNGRDDIVVAAEIAGRITKNVDKLLMTLRAFQN